MALPEKRVRGYWVVLALVIAAMVAAIPVVLFRPESVLGPPLLLLRADGTIAATPTTVEVSPDFGPHCSKFLWNERRRFLAVEADVNLTGVDALILQRYGLGSSNLRSDGGDLVRTRLFSNGSTLLLTSPVDESTLGAFTREMGSANVTVNGTTYGPGDAWTMRFEYDVVTANGTLHVVEVIAFRNEGIVFPHLVPPAGCA